MRFSKDKSAPSATEYLYDVKRSKSTNIASDKILSFLHRIVSINEGMFSPYGEHTVNNELNYSMKNNCSICWANYYDIMDIMQEDSLLAARQKANQKKKHLGKFLFHSFGIKF